MRAADGRGILVALGVTQILAWGSSYYLLAVLGPPIAAETGWPLTFVVAGFSVALVVAGLASPAMGRVVQARGGRPVLVTGSLLLAAGLALVALARGPASYLVAWSVLGLGMACGLYDAAFGTLGRLYGKEARRRIAALTLFSGSASSIAWPASAYLLETVGWRGACLAYAALHLAVGLPIHLLAVPSAPARAGTPQSGSAAAVAVRGTERDVLVLACIVALASSVFALVSVHLVAMLQARGLPLAEAVALGAVVGISKVSSRFVETVLGRRYHPAWTMLAATAAMAAGVALLLADLPVVGLGLALYGAGNGIYTIARGTLPLALVAPERYAAVVGALGRPALVGSAVSPLVGAFLIERAGVVATLWVVLAASLAATVGAALLLRAARRPVLAGSGA